MPELLVGPVLRHVTETSATIFVETDAAAVVAINGASTPTFEVEGHHYALVIMEGLAPGSFIEYTVEVDGTRRWPVPESKLPPSVIRTLGDQRPLRLLFGSCRAAAPHEPPWSLSATDHPQGKGVDSLRAHGLRMLEQLPQDWPDLLLMLGDQVYADDPSPGVRERMRARNVSDSTPPDLVGGFEEYTWLYQESWSPEVERWVLSVVPSAMIFDDHDMIDDWNISASWVHEIRRQPWWEAHVVGGLMSYWVYQHLGNLSPAEIRKEGMLDRLIGSDDGGAFLREWAVESERFTPVEGGYRFSFMRQLGNTRVVVIDCRNGRNLEPTRAMVGAEEWTWIEAQCRDLDGRSTDHLLLATSLPVMVPGGLHGLQVWNAALCSGRWGRVIARLSERLRRSVDLDDWSAFETSMNRLLAFVDELRTGPHHPETISLLAGDIHFSYVARAEFASGGSGSRVYQLVSSPIRNALARRDRRVIRYALTRTGRRMGGLMTRSVRAAAQPAAWTLTHGPEFGNEMGLLTIDGRRIELLMERARPDDDGEPILEAVIRTEL